MTIQSIEEQHEEWKMRVEVCNEILKKIPMCNGEEDEDLINREYWSFIEEERKRNRRMVEAIERYLL